MHLTPDHSIFLVSHTHWDREWYLPFERTRAMLVEVVDRLLDILETEPDFKAFYLDGQAIVLDDYLEIRPHKEAVLRKYVEAGRLRIGPWYVASDVVLVSGESLVRNLRYGLRRCRQFGAPTLVGYMPDQFGHISQMPQILQGFGIDNAVMGRGRNRGETPNEFFWESPDGSQVLAVFLNNWYSNARNVPKCFDEAVTYLADAAAKAAKHATGPHVLLLNGCDHLEADRHVGVMVRRLREELGWSIQHTGLEEYIQALRVTGAQLSVWQGEMRQDQGGRLDAGTISARMPLKADNFRLLSFIEKTLEPLGAFVAALGGTPDRDILDQIWQRTMQNHPHDSICGCSIDEVAREMAARTASTRAMAEALAEAELRRLGTLLRPAPAAAITPEIAEQTLPTETRSTEPQAPPSGYLVFAPAGLSSGWVHTATIDVPIAPSGRSPVRMIPNPDRFHDQLTPTMTLPDGQQLPLQALSWHRTERLCLDVSHLPETQPVHRFEVAYEMGAPDRTVTYVDTNVEIAKPYYGTSIVVGPTALENQHLRVDVAADGSLNVLHKKTGRLYTRQCVFEDGGDAGDTYHYVKPAADRVICNGGAWSAEVVADGPLLGAIVIRRSLRTPASLTPDRMERSSTLVDVDIAMRVQLRRHSPFLECTTTIVNRALDHRLRVLFQNGPRAEMMRSLSAFDAVDRALKPDPAWHRAACCRPQLGWTSISDESSTLSILSGDLPEVEATATPDGVSLALTLLRCVGAVSRRTSTPNVLLAPEAQLLGTHTFSFAIYPQTRCEEHSIDTRSADEEPQLTPNQALALFIGHPLLIPAEGIAGVDQMMPRTIVEACQPAFVISAVEPAPPEYSGAGFLVRGWNASDEPISVRLNFGVQLAPQAFQTDLAGNRITELAVKQTDVAHGVGATLEFLAKPKEIVTVQVFGTCMT